MDGHLQLYPTDLRDGAADVAQGQLPQEVLLLLQVPPTARPQPPEGAECALAECIIQSQTSIPQTDRYLERDTHLHTALHIPSFAVFC